MKRPDIPIGTRFTRLVVVGVADRRRHSLVCRCDCGAERIVIASCLLRGTTKSCRCLHRDTAHLKSRIHGGTKTPEWSAWRDIIARCENPKVRSYADYGGRGIKVCAEWRNDFAAFLRDVGPRPFPELSIDRVDNDGHYEPGNCRWATAKQQANNKRNSRRND